MDTETTFSNKNVKESGYPFQRIFFKMLSRITSKETIHCDLQAGSNIVTNDPHYEQITKSKKIN